MADHQYKEVRFDLYCGTCEHSDKDGNEEPCGRCIDHPFNIDSHKPVKYEEKVNGRKKTGTGTQSGSRGARKGKQKRAVV